METWGSARKEALERACENCGTRYPRDDPACPNCFRPAGAAYSRWRGGPTSFSLTTKLTIVAVLVGLAVGHGVFTMGTLGRFGLLRTIEVALVLLLPVPFLFRRTRVR